MLTEGHDFSSREKKAPARQRHWEGKDKQTRHGCTHFESGTESSPFMWWAAEGQQRAPNARALCQLCKGKVTSESSTVQTTGNEKVSESRDLSVCLDLEWGGSLKDTQARSPSD